jgi:hypothetical protein
MMTELTDDKINELWYQSQNDVEGTSSGHTTQQHYFARLLEKALAPSEPVAWMWQHEETGNIGFTDHWQIENGFEKNNPRLKIINPLYTSPPNQAALIAELVDALEKINTKVTGEAFGEWGNDGLTRSKRLLIANICGQALAKGKT